MIIEHVGNLLDLQRGILVHGCNCIGAMGSGIAGQIRKKWEVVYDSYKSYEHANSGLYLGDIIVVANPKVPSSFNKHVHYFTHDLPNELIVVNAMTQYNTMKFEGDVVVDYDAISAAFARIKILARETKLPVHFPLIGCGLAGGKWEEVAPRIEAALGDEIEKHLWIFKG